MKRRVVVLTMVSLLGMGSRALAQESSDTKEYRVNLLFGLNQPLLGGFNVEGNFIYDRWIFDYSHGVNLQFDNALLDAANQAQGIDVLVPWTTGFGIGYFMNDWLNLRLEPKWHRFELFPMGTEQTTANSLGGYTTFSMGAGLYANLRPFKRQENFLKGFTVAPSIRYWPRVGSSLDNHAFTFEQPGNGGMIEHEAMQVGVNNTPWVLNVSVGYSLSWLKK
ncbi:MAG TPA: hypothetical protein DCE41_04015 [Cytophagales bacterium]|nr:hypothetical protein [Cytophagales bacterium]HAA20809.1 hypothetical protein [Cytophagales bacterium]HAP59098.1 hypothetical protein [Cytophagales bacterium]